MFLQENIITFHSQSQEVQADHNPAGDTHLDQLEISPNVILDQLASRPENALLMGVCEDGLPLFLDLMDPSSGGVMFIGDNSFGNQRHLHFILDSVCKLISPTIINIHMISPQLDRYAELLRKPHFLQAYLPHDDASWILIEEICHLVEDRQSGMPTHPIQILAIDDLALLIQDFTAKQLADFKWLLDASTKAMVWVFATLTSTNIRQDFFATIEQFRTKVFGRVSSPSSAVLLSGSSFLDISELMPGVESVVMSGGEQFKIYIPQL